MHEDYPHGSLSIEFDQILSQALNEGRTVELDHGEEKGFVVVIDGVPLPNENVGFPRDSFGFDLEDCSIEGEDAEALVAELARPIQYARTKRRNNRADTATHAAAEGLPDVAGD